jgi:uncharacterized membrane protein (DUF485 family)
MKSIQLLTSTVEDLWSVTYGVIAGWGVTVTILVVALVYLTIRFFNLQKRLEKLENRIVTEVRDLSFRIDKR